MESGDRENLPFMVLDNGHSFRFQQYRRIITVTALLVTRLLYILSTEFTLNLPYSTV